MIKLGPVLQFLGCENGAWGVSALVVADETDDAPTFFYTAGGVRKAATGWWVPVAGLACKAWRFDFAVAQTGSPQDIAYDVAGRAHRFSVPAAGAPPALAYASCNGFSDLQAMKTVREPDALWARMGRLHTQQDRVGSTTFGPLHLLLLGGDQIYSDAMWSALPEFTEWLAHDWYTRTHIVFTASMQSELQRYFAMLYIDRWSKPDMAAMLASVPTVMMWDDHDIMDGWGSHPAELHASPVFQGMFSIAKAAFELFQRQMMGAPAPCTLPAQPAHNAGYRMGPAGLLVLDMRSERRPRSTAGGTLMAERVMSEESWQAVYAWLDAQQAAGGMTHLFVMSSIPVVHPSFETLEKMIGVVPGQHEIADDLRDHWTSPPHKAERLRLIHRLLAVSAKGTRVTLLSGDVHVAAVGVIESDRINPGDNASSSARVINQLTASGIVHPPPPGVALSFLERACEIVEQIDRGITGTMHEFPTTRHRMIGCRNFLTLQPDAPDGSGRYWANWWAEGQAHPYTKVIHRVG
jgi:PhoD related phosphatase